MPETDLNERPKNVKARELFDPPENLTGLKIRL